MFIERLTHRNLRMEATVDSPISQPLNLSPEDALRAPKVHPEDAHFGLECRLEQALGVLTLLTSMGAHHRDDNHGHFIAGHSAVMSSLYAVSSLLIEAQTLSEKMRSPI